VSIRLDKAAPAAITELYRPLWEDVAGLYLKWRIYRQVFATAQADIDVLNETAGVFFNLTHNMWIREVVRVLGCLTDPSDTGGKKNLSLPALVKAINQGKGPTDLQLKVDHVISSYKPFKDHRNRNISHHDLDTRKGIAVVPLPPISRIDIEHAVRSSADLINAVEAFFGVPKTDFDKETADRADGDSLLAYLRVGRDHGVAE
jgi:HEPN superfamily AbiU2-like protein